MFKYDDDYVSDLEQQVIDLTKDLKEANEKIAHLKEANEEIAHLVATRRPCPAPEGAPDLAWDARS